MPPYQGIGLKHPVSSVSNVVFDVGRVLIDFSYADFFALLMRHGADISGEEDFSAQVGLVGYEQGKISDVLFLQRLNALLVTPLPETQLISAWNNLFTPIHEMLDFAKNLKRHCQVYLLSNTSPLHWQHLQQTYHLHDYCHDLLASFQLGAMKPAAEIFAAAADRFRLEPEMTIFIDDKIENVAGAIACGWQGLLHQDSATTIIRLEELIERYA